ncbi:MAG: glycosyltransferase family 39 protein, partial [Solirubrobacteraceae bacterium]
MTALALLAVASAWLLGGLAVSVLWPRNRALRDDLPLILALGMGVGFGLTSTLFFFASLVGDHPLQISLPAEGLLLLGLTGWLRGRRAGAQATPRPLRRYSWLELGLATLFVQASLIALLVTFRAYSAEPYGSWDGWAIWNLHARMLFRGGGGWWTMLRQPAIAWSHLDYPLLVPASVARAWAFTGTDAPAVAALVSTCFGIATVWLLVAAAAKFCPPAVALTSGLLLLGTPFFVTFSSNEHADIPLGFFMLAAVVLITLSSQTPESRGLPALAGVVTGLAAWTKNEGLLFAAIVALVWTILTIRRQPARAAHGFW